MTTRFADHLLTGNHAGRPSASGVPEGTLYSCTTHSLVYQSTGGTWGTWLTAGGVGALDDLSDVAITSPTTDDVLVYNGSSWVNDTSPGGGSATIQYGSLKPGTPDDDFDYASLSGAGWAANNQAGSFALTDCFPQAVDGSHVQLGYQDKSGSILKSQSNVDLDYRVGGFSCEGNLHPAQGQKMPGIAVVDSSGNGVGLVFNSDLNTYLIELTSYAFSGTSYGSWTNSTPEYAIDSRSFAMRITRATNTWTGYLSFDSVNWTAMSATGSKTITVNRIAIGTWKPNDGAARGRILADWADVT